MRFHPYPEFALLSMGHNLRTFSKRSEDRAVVPRSPADAHTHQHKNVRIYV
jgi:hypothetical protein